MKFKVGDKVRMWNIEGRWQETLGERVYTVTEVHEDWEAQGVEVVSVEFRCEHCGYVAVAQEFIAHDSDWFVLVEPEPAPREWMDAAEAVKTLDCDTTVWGWSNGDCVRRWYLFEGRWFTTDDTTPLSWGVDHQPTHVMIRGEGEEPPAPPVVVTDWERVCRYVADNLDGMDAYNVAGLFIGMEDRIAALEKRVNELSK